jgi:WD40 repeat protein
MFNEHLMWVGWLPLKVRLVHFAYFYEKKSTLITAGIDGCYMFKININSKYEPKQALNLDPSGKFFFPEIGPKTKLEKMPLWVKGLKVMESLDFIFTWSQLKSCFNGLDGKLKYKYNQLTSPEDLITDVIVNEEYKYFLTSTHSGMIIVWKLQRKKQKVHTFNFHFKSVTSLTAIPGQPTLFISASNDNTIRISSLDKFVELYNFILPAGVTNIHLLSESIFACFYKDQIKIGHLHHLASSFHNS